MSSSLELLDSKRIRHDVVFAIGPFGHLWYDVFDISVVPLDEKAQVINV